MPYSDSMKKARDVFLVVMLRKVANWLHVS